MNIQENQNQPESLKKLAAQRLLYNYAKWVRNIDILAIFSVATLGIVASVMEDQRLGDFVPLISLLTWFFGQEVIKRSERALKTEATTIQEDFDCFVLDLPWPAHKGIQLPTPDRVRQLNSRASKKRKFFDRKVTKGLKDWYPLDKICGDDTILSKVHCQKMNCWWDVTLRQKWCAALKFIFCIFLALVLCLSVLYEITVAKFVAILASNIRVLAWGRSEIKDQAETIQRIHGIHRHISSFTRENPPSPYDIRCIQDEILEHRRSNPPVPDWFYWWKRRKQEEEAVTL